MHENHDFSPEVKVALAVADMIGLKRTVRELVLQGLSPSDAFLMRKMLAEISEMLAGGSA